jgi:hypothetical protein
LDIGSEENFKGVVVCSQGARSEAPLVDSASLPLEHRAVYGPPSHLPPPPAYGPPHGGGIGGGDDSWPLATPDMPQIKHLQVQCEKTNMRVNIEFDRPFYGMIFSKGGTSVTRPKCPSPRESSCQELKLVITCIHLTRHLPGLGVKMVYFSLIAYVNINLAIFAKSILI